MLPADQRLCALADWQAFLTKRVIFPALLLQRWCRQKQQDTHRS
jgi:hypothetical protein